MSRPPYWSLPRWFKVAGSRQPAVSYHWNPYPWWRHALQLGLYREDFSFDDPFDPVVDFGSFVSDTAEERLSADYNSTFFLPSLAGLTPTFTLGAYAEDEDFEQDSLFLFQGSGTPNASTRAGTRRPSTRS